MIRVFSRSLFVSVSRICSEFETIRKTAQKIPENTDEIIQVIDYINFIKTKGIAELNKKIKVNIMSCLIVTHIDFSNLILIVTLYYYFVFHQEAYSRMIYLLDVQIIETKDLELNSSVFLWPQKILHVFELCDEVLLLCPLYVPFVLRKTWLWTVMSFSRGYRRPRRKGSKHSLLKEKNYRCSWKSWDAG